MSMNLIERRNAILRELARQIAKDQDTDPGDSHWGWAVQHVNETVMQRNAFDGVAGITAEAADKGLADYLNDHQLWYVRIYKNELARGMRRCVAFQGHSTLPDGTLLHRNSQQMVDSWRKAGKVQTEYRVEDCPAPHEHR